MNDQIPMPPRKWMLRIGLPILILASAAVVLIITSWSTIMPARTVRTIPIVIRQIETDEAIPLQDELEAETVVQAPGWVEADPFSVYAAALTEGVVEDVLVLEGDRVSKGQPVARLIDDEAEIALRKSEANVRHLIADVELAKARLSQLPAKMKGAEAHQHALEDEVRRKAKLVESGAVAAGPLERLKKKLDAAVADVEHLELEEKVLQVEVQDRESLLKEGEAARDHQALVLERMTVISPIDGVVIERLTSPGSVIQFGNGEHGTHIVHLYNPEKLQVRADIPLAQAAGVKVGQPARIVVDVQPDRIFSGEVTRFIHRADLQKNTVEAKIRIIDPSSLLKPDMLARVKILPAKTESAPGEMRVVPRVFIPGDSIHNNVVMVFQPDSDGLGIARATSVKTGTREFDGWIEILSGLSSGDRVILDQVVDGDTVRMEAD